MSFSRLSEIDLARALATKPGPELEAAMRLYNAGGGAWSYGPTRTSTADLVAARPPLLEIAPAGWAQLARQIIGPAPEVQIRYGAI